jgi:hypothetical protein
MFYALTGPSWFWLGWLGTHTLVRSYYVHGIMDGKAVKELRELVERNDTGGRRYRLDRIILA